MHSGSSVTWLRSLPSMNRLIDCSAQTRCLNLAEHLKAINAFSHGLGRDRRPRLSAWWRPQPGCQLPGDESARSAVRARPTPAVRSSRLQAAKRSLATVLGESWLPASPSDWSPVTRPCRIGIGQCAAPDDAHIRKLCSIGSGQFHPRLSGRVNEIDTIVAATMFNAAQAMIGTR
jgi:hypothetical protein